jgi:NADH-quinone oxidoreductase subunit E
MSVRRLADEAVQPESFAFSPENAAWAEGKMREYPPGRQQSAVIPILFRAQEQEGWVSRAAIETVAGLLDMPYIRVLEVATFYTQFQLQPVGTRAHIQVCGTTPCMLRGAEALIDVCKHKIGPNPLEPNADGTMSWEEVECLGACVNAPLVMIGSDTYEDLTAERFGAIVDAFAAGRGGEIEPGPQIDRQFGGAEGGPTTLLETPTAERTYRPFPPPPEAAAAPAAPTPTAKGRGSEVTEENAPALKGTPPEAKVSMAKAEAERARAADAAQADGTPNDAMREGAVGAESPAGKVDGGKATKPAPRRLFEAPEGPADDLKLISGVGPVLEKTLNAIGITTWRQVAALSAEQIEAVESEAGFRGRIGRDNWVRQAEALARGGAEEYRKVFGKDPK